MRSGRSCKRYGVSGRHISDAFHLIPLPLIDEPAMVNEKGQLYCLTLCVCVSVYKQPEWYEKKEAEKESRVARKKKKRSRQIR